jgi:hypothetical protein
MHGDVGCSLAAATVKRVEIGSRKNVRLRKIAQHGRKLIFHVQDARIAQRNA